MERRGRRPRVAVPGGRVAGNPTGIERRGDGRKDGAGPPALTWSSHDHFDSKTILRVLHKETQKQSKINLGREFLFFQKCVLPVRNTWEYKRIHSSSSGDRVSPHPWAWTVQSGDAG